MTRAIVVTCIACLAMTAAGASAAEHASPAATLEAAAPADAAICPDDATKAAERAKREAALAELGRRLAAEPKEEGEFRVLNRTGHNYGRSMSDVSAGWAPPAPQAPPAKVAPAPAPAAKAK